MRIYVVTRQGNTVQNQVHTMLLTAPNAEVAEHMAREWRGQTKEPFGDCKLNITEVAMDKSQIIMIQSL